MKRIFLLLFLTFLSLSSNAERGGWISSGGEIFRFAKNPWFVKNTTVVSYCFKIDAATFSASQATVREVFQEALAYWKTELASTVNPAPGFAAIGTQTFTEVANCDVQTDLKVLLGEGALKSELDPEDLKEFGDPRRFLGVSVRTDYDHETLKGGGFIYLSSDLGPRAYNTLPFTDHLISKAWEEKRLLLYAFLHELGHVFGIPHTGTGLMSEVFLDQLLHVRFSNYYLNNPVERFLTPPLNFDICTLNGSFHATFFQIPADSTCLRLEGKMNGARIDWTVYSLRNPKSQPELAGTIRADKTAQSAMSAKTVGVVHLPPEQKIFSMKNRLMNTFLIGPVFDEGQATGVYKAKSGHRTVDLQILLQADSITMTGMVGTRMLPVLVYSPPTLLKNIFPIEMP